MQSEIEGKASGWRAYYIEPKWIEEGEPATKKKKAAAKKTTKKPAKKKAAKADKTEG